MDVIEKLQKLSDEEVVAICKTDMINKQELSALISEMAEAQRRDGELRYQAYARYVSEVPAGMALFKIHQASPGRDAYAQAAFEKFTKGPMAPHAVRGDGKQHLAGDGIPDLEKLVDEFVQTHPNVSRPKAYEQMMRTSAGTKAYQREKMARLKKSAGLMGNAYGL